LISLFLPSSANSVQQQYAYHVKYKISYNKPAAVVIPDTWLRALSMFDRKSGIRKIFSSETKSMERLWPLLVSVGSDEKWPLACRRSG